MAKKAKRTLPVAKKSKKTAKSKSAAAKPGKGKAAARKPPKREADHFIGRPKITGEEKLFLLFKDDYQAREVFDFLRVQTVKELEEFSAQEIFRRLTQPMRNTVDRIRRHLAERNRCLAGDEEFAWEWKSESQRTTTS
jgi:hypothetical protein